jgi:hypothetical protein
MQSVDLRPTQFEVVAPTPSQRGVMDLHDLRQLASLPTSAATQTPIAAASWHTSSPSAVARFRVSASGEMAWSRIYVKDGVLTADLGRGAAIELPDEKAQRRLAQADREWPILPLLTLRVTVTRSWVSTTRMTLVSPMPRIPQWPAGRLPPRRRCSKRWAPPSVCGEIQLPEVDDFGRPALRIDRYRSAA